MLRMYSVATVAPKSGVSSISPPAAAITAAIFADLQDAEFFLAQQEGRIFGGALVRMGGEYGAQNSSSPFGYHLGERCGFWW